MPLLGEVVVVVFAPRNAGRVTFIASWRVAPAATLSGKPMVAAEFAIKAGAA